VLKNTFSSLKKCVEFSPKKHAFRVFSPKKPVECSVPRSPWTQRLSSPSVPSILRR
jgi:hypothetical protein